MIMSTAHSLTVVCTCPVDGSTDVYQASIYVDGEEPLPVEQILAVVAEIRAGPPRFQEEITMELAQRLNARVETEGLHSNVTTICTAMPELNET